MAVRVTARVEHFPIAGSFTISRGVKREAVVVVAEATDGPHTGRGEAVPYARYGETVDAVVHAIGALDPVPDRLTLQHVMPAGAARNAVDCALLDLEVRRTGMTVESILGLPEPSGFRPILTCYTLSLDDPGVMAAKAAALVHLPLLKLKLGGGAGDVQRMRAVRAARPDARLVADANEAWRPEQLDELMAAAVDAGLELIEQPLPQGEDAALAAISRRVPVCADESAHTAADLAALRDRYDAVNIKLDKAGGLTAAAAMLEEAHSLGLKTMLGCMVASSLAMAPALRLARYCDWVDLDGPLLLAADRPGGLSIENGIIASPPPGLWG